MTLDKDEELSIEELTEENMSEQSELANYDLENELDEKEYMSEDSVIEDDVDNDVHNDEILEKDYLSILVSQEEDKALYYEIFNIYRTESKRDYKSKFALKKDPPVLSVKDNYGEEVKFILTENFTRELISGLKEVERAYAGFSGPIDLEAPDKFLERIIYYFKKNPFKFIFPIVLIIVVSIISNL